MAKLINDRVRVEVSTKITIELTEEEARALDGIFGYNVDVFLKVFYERMGAAYVKPHENGVRSLHATIRDMMDGPLRKVEDKRTMIREALTPKPGGAA